jgi:solute carrier family 25 S-adenosylmethionine transporter 26
MLLRDIPFSVIQFSLYECLKQHLRLVPHDQDINNGLCGSLAGALSGFVVTPLDVIKTR